MRLRLSGCAHAQCRIWCREKLGGCAYAQCRIWCRVRLGGCAHAQCRIWCRVRLGGCAHAQCRIWCRMRLGGCSHHLMLLIWIGKGHCFLLLLHATIMELLYSPNGIVLVAMGTVDANKVATVVSL